MTTGSISSALWRCLARTGGVVVVGGLATLTAHPLAAQTNSAPVAYENRQIGFAAAIPAGCRVDEGPGTLDAVCAPDLDAERSKTSAIDTALLLAIAAETITPATGDTPEALANAFTEAQFRAELPDVVCGTADGAKVVIANVARTDGPNRITYAADVSCPPVRFAGLPQRQARALFVIEAGHRFRVLGRVPQPQFEAGKSVIEAFVSSFRTLPRNN